MVVWSVSALLWMMGPLRRRPLHAWRVRASGSRPHARAQASRLAKWWAEGALVLWHGIRVVVVRRWGTDRWTPMLRQRPLQRVVHKWRHLVYDVSRRGDGRRGSGHRRCLVVDHVWRGRSLRWVLHGVAERRRWWWRGTVVLLLRWGHDVVRVGHNRLAGVVSRVVVRGWARGSLWVWVTWARAARVIVDGHSYEIAVLACGHSGYAEGLRGKASR